MMYWVYKVNSKETVYSKHQGNWREVFGHTGLTEWGDTLMKGVAEVAIGDRLIAYQTDRNELVGIARVEKYKPYSDCHSLMIRPIEAIGAKVRPLKQSDRRIAALSALDAGKIATAYAIDSGDARYLLAAARRAARDGALYERPGRKRALSAKEEEEVVAAFRDLAPRQRRIYERLLRVVARTARLRLCRTHHWAFDRGLWAIKPDTLKIAVHRDAPNQVKKLAGRTITRPRGPGGRKTFGGKHLIARWKAFSN